MGVMTENKIVGQSPTADGCSEGIKVVFSDGFAVGASEGLAVVGEMVGDTDNVGTGVGETGAGSEDGLEDGVKVASPQYM